MNADARRPRSGSGAGPEGRGAADDPDDRAQVRAGSGLILAGGKVDPEAIRRAAEQAEEGEDDADLRRVRFDIRRDLGSRLDRYLTSRITFLSRTRLQKLVESGAVTVNGRPAKPSTRLGAGDSVEVVVPPPPQRGTVPEDIHVDVLYEDDHLIVLNKRADIIVHPARSELSGTLINALAWRFRHVSGGSLSSVGEEIARPGVVHRLDRHTSGCIVFAKTDEAHWKLGRQFEQRTVDKRYLAVVHGWPDPPADVIDLPIGPHPSREKGYREKYVVRHDEAGRDALTICRVRARYATPEAGPARAAGGRDGRGHAGPVHAGRFALVELELKTGRTHQIRVHLSHRGWPIVGDGLYGGSSFSDREGRVVIDRQALHAARLALAHPADGRAMVFTAPAPADLAGLVRALGPSRVDAEVAASAGPPNGGAGLLVDMNTVFGGPAVGAAT